jgi:5-(aminomethyl)-3-furanmethanol phosphate kinase
MWVVKLGGSLARDPRLVNWLRMLAEFGAGRVTVVPGGATFADTVRQSQAHWGFDDLAAHNMAVLAMAQTAHMLHALEPRLVLAANDSAIRQALHGGRPRGALALKLT